MTNIVLADEITRTSPKTQASLLEAMEEKQVTVASVTYPLPRPFMVIATQNPVDYLGTYNLPEAQLDRFMIKISIGYPSASDVQSEVTDVKVNKDLVSFVTKFIQGTRKDSNISLGASPRATLALIRAAQAKAYLDGRTYCIPDDILKLAVPVISHRIILSPEARLAQAKVEKVLKDIIKKIPVPVFNENEKEAKGSK